jgi:hypothetical protein
MPHAPHGLVAIACACRQFACANSSGKGQAMALFMDAHNLGGPVTIDDVAKAHAADLQAQDAHGVRYLRYWVDQQHGKVFCLVDAPDAEAAAAVHQEAHGLVADEIYPVTEGA